MTDSTRKTDGEEMREHVRKQSVIARLTANSFRRIHPECLTARSIMELRSSMITFAESAAEFADFMGWYVTEIDVLKRQVAELKRLSSDGRR